MRDFYDGQLVAQYMDNGCGAMTFWQVVKILEYKPHGMNDGYEVEDFDGNRFEIEGHNLSRNCLQIDNWDAVEYEWAHRKKIGD